MKGRGSIIRNNFHNCRTKTATLFVRRHDLYALLTTIKSKTYTLYAFFHAPVVTQLIIKVYRKIKESIFVSLPFLY